MTSPAETAPRKTWLGGPRWLAGAFIVSLALNLLILGIVGGAAWRWRTYGPPSPDMMGGFAAFASHLPAERRRDLAPVLEPQRAEIKRLRMSMREARDAANRVMTVEPFDPVAFAAAHSRVLDVQIALRRAEQTALVTAISKLTAEERRSLQIWRERFPRRARSDGDELPGRR
jgi:uncharacterized membrane protein